MGERDDARHQVEQKRERIDRLAHEVSRRMTPGYAKERAREMARDRMYRARDRAVESSWFAPLLGAGIGALVAKALQSRAQDRSWDRWDRWDRGRFGASAYEPYRGNGRYGPEAEYDAYGSETSLPRAELGAEESGEDAGSRISGKASEMKERARSTAEQVKGRVREATASVRERLPDRGRIRESAHDDTGLWAFGALALGALFGFALPESRRERELLEPARRKARELGSQAKDLALEKGTEAMEKATEKVAGIGAEQRSSQPSTSSSEPPTALH
jgi:hypothetical protein